MAKPDPRSYALACARLGATAGETAFLDDTADCVAGARAAGLHAVLFSGTTQAIRDIEGLLRPGRGPGVSGGPARAHILRGTRRRAGGMGPPPAAARR
jgi:FMN phosphatase YigB (HAD superfamily)